MLERFEELLQSGEKAIEPTKAAFAKLQKHYPDLRECNVKLKSVYEARLIEGYVESANDKRLLKDIMDNLENTDKEYDKVLFDVQSLIDEQELARHDRKVAEMHRNATVLQDTDDIVNLLENEGGAGSKAKCIYKEQPSFQPSIKVSVSSSTTDFRNWLDDISAYFEVSHAEVLATSLQQKFIKKWVEPSFWSLINEKNH